MGKIRKELSSILRKTLIILALAIPLTFGSCEPKNDPPEAFQEINPTSGDAPLEVRVRGYGKDPNGIADIKKYRLYRDNSLIQTKSNPIDTNLVFNDAGTYKIHVEVIDSKNQSNATKPVTITAYQGPYIEQSADLTNDVEISYSATLHKIANAELKINKDGKLFKTEQITDNSQTSPDFQKTFTYASDGTTKGNYEFVLTSGDLEKRASVQIPDYKSYIDLSGVNTDIDECESKTFDLSDKTEEKNPEDRPVTIKSAKSLDGKTKPTLDNYTLTVKSFFGQVGDYEVELELQNSQGKLEKSLLNGNVIQGKWNYYVHPFVSTNSNGAAWDTFTTKTQRDTYLDEKLEEDWTDTIPGIIDIWDCTEYSEQVMRNFHGLPDPIGYSGSRLDSLYFYGGTDKNNGDYGLPVYFVYFIGEGIEHNMTCTLTGDINNGDITKFVNWNFIESSNDKTNQKPGLSYMPKNCTVEIKAPPKNRQGQYVSWTDILRFEIENGVQTSYWINPTSNLKIITQRENKK